MMSNNKLPQALIDIIVGTLLGDAKMEFSNNGKGRFIYELGIKHRDYLVSVHKLFEDFVNKEPQEYLHFDKRTGKHTTSIRFSTVTSELFNVFACLFYIKTPNTRKVVKVLPARISELLTPRALAYWIMDDGQYVKNGGLTLCTDNFTSDEVEQLKTVLETKYGFICTLHKKGDNLRIYISGKSMPKLIEVVGIHMHPSFNYKLMK